jgi:endonuclease G
MKRLLFTVLLLCVSVAAAPCPPAFAPPPGLRPLSVRELAQMPPLPPIPGQTTFAAQHRLSETGRYGLPKGTAYDFGEFVLGFDGRPEWSLEVLHGPLKSVKRAGSFKVDKQTGYAADEADYRGSGWDIGHLTPAEDAQKEMTDTFIFANACPQDPTFNRGLWAEVERTSRENVADGSTAWVITFPIYSAHPKTIGPHKVQIPADYAKSELIVKGGKPTKIVSWEAPNEKPPADSTPDEFRVPLKKLETDSGLKLWELAPEGIK